MATDDPPPELEYATRVIPIDDGSNFLGEISKLMKEGWQIVPHVAPIAVYQLVRVKNAPQNQAAGYGTLTINDSLVSIIPAAAKPDAPQG